MSLRFIIPTGQSFASHFDDCHGDTCAEDSRRPCPSTRTHISARSAVWKRWWRGFQLGHASPLHGPICRLRECGGTGCRCCPVQGCGPVPRSQMMRAWRCYFGLTPACYDDLTPRGLGKAVNPCLRPDSHVVYFAVVHPP